MVQVFGRTGGHKVVVSGNREADNETIDIYKMPGPGRITHVTFASDAALGSSLSVDVVDGGSTGTGTDVVVASTDNLNGEEQKEGSDLSNDELADGDVIKITFDNYTAVVGVSWAVTIELYPVVQG